MDDVQKVNNCMSKYEYCICYIIANKKPNVIVWTMWYINVIINVFISGNTTNRLYNA
jgi:hypothetical protein